MVLKTFIHKLLNVPCSHSKMQLDASMVVVYDHRIDAAGSTPYCTRLGQLVRYFELYRQSKFGR